MNPKIKLLSIAVFLMFAHHQAWSQTIVQDDESQLPIEIEADQLQAEDQTGTTIYEGNVIATQGSMTLKGDKMVIIHPERQLERLTTTGQPAYFERYLIEQESWVKGHAQTLIYHAESRRVELIGSAYLEQENQHQIEGDKLVYDLENQTLNASSEQESSRIKMTITPQQDTPKEQP